MDLRCIGNALVSNNLFDMFDAAAASDTLHVAISSVHLHTTLSEVPPTKEVLN